MKAAETNIDTLLNGIKHFRVPLYQRTYSWGKDQWQALWDAIVDQAEAVADDDSAPGHFLGSVVLAPGPGTAAMPVWIVIDGQQRLTTLSLALAALRDQMRGNDARRAEYVHEDYLINRRATGNERLKLLPTQADRAAYLACIEGTAHAGGGGNVGEAYRFFRQKLVEFDDPNDRHDLERLELAITRRLEIVEIVAAHEDNVHRIFRVPQQHRDAAQPGRPAAQLRLHAAADARRARLRDVLAPDAGPARLRRHGAARLARPDPAGQRPRAPRRRLPGATAPAATPRDEPGRGGDGGRGPQARTARRAPRRRAASGA